MEIGLAVGAAGGFATQSSLLGCGELPLGQFCACQVAISASSTSKMLP
jgi:hypothetical protein